MTEIKIKYYSFYDLPREFNSHVKDYRLVVGIKNVPKSLEDWRSINPRDPKTNSPVFKAILQSLENNPRFFFDKNAGLSVLADDLTIDETTCTATLHLGDKSTNGLFDGGHTHKAIMQYLQVLGDKESEAEVRMQVLVGVKKDEIVNLVTARNSFTAVQSESLANLKGSFEGIKQVLEGQPYADLIAYHENEVNSKGELKSIPIRDVLGYLTIFNIIKYPATKSVTFAYGSRKKVIGEYVKFVEEIEGDDEKKKQFESLLKLLPEIIKLRDKIYKELQAIWSTLSKGYGMSTTKTKYSRERFAKLVKTSPLFADFGTELDTPMYFVPDSFLYPILTAFRANLKLNKPTNSLEWIKDLDGLWEEEKTLLVKKLKGNYFTFDQSTSRIIKTWESFSDHINDKFKMERIKRDTERLKRDTERMKMQMEKMNNQIQEAS